MNTIANSIKEYAKGNGLKVYDVANILGIGQSNFYNTYMHSTDESKLEFIKNAIDNYMKGND